MPGREYVWPGTAFTAFFLGAKWEGFGLPDNPPFKSHTSGLIFTSAACMLGVVSYGAGYLLGYLTS